MKVAPARMAAFEILLRIETERAYSSALLHAFESTLSPPDRALCHELTLGTLRRQIYIDRTIDIFSTGKKIDAAVRIALRLALYQIYFLDKIPQYSAINESVNLVQLARKTSAKAFVNAILRRATREKRDLEYTDEADRISVASSHPRWLVEKWIADHGMETAEEIARANNETPDTAFRLLGEPSDAARELVASSRGSAHVKGCFIAPGAAHRLHQLTELGEIYVQDEASQMVARAIEVPANGRSLDVCAAPGGKTGLVAVTNPHSSLIVAGDLRDSRVRLLRDNCRSQGADRVAVVQYDATRELPFAERCFDNVLVDAPCSGTGTIRRNPEIRYHLAAQDFAELKGKQLVILGNASKLVKNGGSLLYSTCSLEREENEDVCAGFIAGNPEFQIMRPNVPDVFVTDVGFAQTWPARDGMDGFFVAAFRRKIARSG